jgi:hypothetical protein
MQYAEHMARDLRLVMLKSLSKHPAYSANDTILQIEAEAFGHSRSRDVIRNELRHLADVGGVILKEAGSVIVATLTLRGAEHVQGKTVLEGVNQPSPGA